MHYMNHIKMCNKNHMESGREIFARKTKWRTGGYPNQVNMGSTKGACQLMHNYTNVPYLLYVSLE